MTLNSGSNNSNNNRQWLDDARQKRSLRTTELGKKAKDELVAKHQEVTYFNIAQKSKEIDPTGRGIHVNTIRTNMELSNYYKEYSSTFKKYVAMRALRRTKKEVSTALNFSDIKTDRNIQDVRKRYKRMSKEELVERLILAEQFISEQVQTWIVEQFGEFPKS